jgi:hypothetical protein
MELGVYGSLQPAYGKKTGPEQYRATVPGWQANRLAPPIFQF